MAGPRLYRRRLLGGYLPVSPCGRRSLAPYSNTFERLGERFTGSGSPERSTLYQWRRHGCHLKEEYICHTSQWCRHGYHLKGELSIRLLGFAAWGHSKGHASGISSSCDSSPGHGWRLTWSGGKGITGAKPYDMAPSFPVPQRIANAARQRRSGSWKRKRQASLWIASPRLVKSAYQRRVRTG